MKKILLLVVCAFISFAYANAQVKELSKEMKKEMKADLKKLEKEKWVGAGADADLEKAIERCYRYMEDSLNWVVAEAIAKETDINHSYARKKAVAKATEQANLRVLLKSRDFLREHKIKKAEVGKRLENVLTLYRDGKKTADGSEALVRVALRISE